MKKIAIAFLIASLRTAIADDDGFVPLFTGTNLDGWVNVNGAPETWSVTNGMIHCTGHPTGAMRTPRQYENFILEGDWHFLVSGGNSGFFIWGTPVPAPGVPFLRGIEMQVLDNGYAAKGKNEWYTTHGDVFPIHGATMKPVGKVSGARSFPTEERSKSSPEWNHYRIVCSNSTIRLSVNGKEVSGGDNCNYRKGYLALESEGAPVEFKNIRIKELPSSGAAAELSAPVDQGWRCLFNGLDLRGWKGSPNWKAAGERLVVGKTADAISSEAEFGDAIFFVDCKTAKDATAPEILCRGATIHLLGATEQYQRFTLTIQNGTATLSRGETEISKTQLPANAPARSPVALRAADSDFFNLFARDL